MGVDYDRYLDVCITANNGWFQFVDQLDVRMSSRERHFSTTDSFGSVQCFKPPKPTQKTGGAKLFPAPPTKLPEKGYVACAVSPNGAVEVVNDKRNIEVYKPLLE
jgi:hypothetical protein